MKSSLLSKLLVLPLGIIWCALVVLRISTPHLIAAALGSPEKMRSLSNSGQRLIEISDLQMRGGLECPSAIGEQEGAEVDIAGIVESMDFSPECLWSTPMKDARTRKDEIVGLAYGSVASVGPAINAGAGNELVIIRTEQDKVMVGMVGWASLEVDLSLPVGVSLSQSVLFGKCKNGVFGYLGWFDSLAFVAKQLNIGKTGIVPYFSKDTGCNAIETVRGATSSIVGAYKSYYWALPPFAIVSGPRIQPLLNFLDEVNSGKPGHPRRLPGDRIGPAPKK